MENGILHVDMNNFYASVETLYAPQYRDVPMAVAGDKESRHGIILAKNMLAKAKGVQTAEPIWQAMRKCPGLQLVPPHHERYAYFSQLAKKIYQDYTDRVEAFSLDECWLDVYGSGLLFGDGRRIAETIRQRVKAELGLTVSIGVSFNKIFAKLGSDYKKPDAVTEFGRREMEEIIWNMPCSDLLLVGPSTEKTLRRYGLHTIGDIARMEPGVMRSLLGRMGETLWVYANGLDDSPVQRVDAQEEPKSIGNSTTLPRDLTTDQEVRETLYSLAETVAARLRRHRMRAQEVQITVRSSDFQEIQRQKRLPGAARDSATLYQAAWELYKKENKSWAVRLLGLRAGRLIREDEEQVSFFEDGDSRKRRERLEDAVDRVRERYGSESLRRAFLVKGEEPSPPEGKALP
ncbi:DNA polymerase IV [Oscillospiraceae bacterium 42-9]